MENVNITLIGMFTSVFLQTLKDKKLKKEIKAVSFKIYTGILAAFPEFSKSA